MADLYRVRTCRFAAGERIFVQGAEPDGLYIIKHGHVRVYRDVGAGQGAAAARIALGVLGPGSFFGEIGAIDQGPRSASVDAVEPTVCLMMPRKLFEDEFRRCQPWLAAVIRLLVARLRETTAMLERQVADAAAHGGLMVVPEAVQSEAVRRAVDELSSLIEAGPLR